MAMESNEALLEVGLQAAGVTLHLLRVNACHVKAVPEHQTIQRHGASWATALRHGLLTGICVRERTVLPNRLQQTLEGTNIELP